MLHSRWLQPYLQILDKAGKAERDKPTSLFGPFVNYKKNSFMTYLKLSIFAFTPTSQPHFQLKAFSLLLTSIRPCGLSNPSLSARHFNYFCKYFLF